MKSHAGQDLSGKVFNNLTVLEKIDYDRYLVACRCGYNSIKNSVHIINNQCHSCNKCKNFKRNKRLGNITENPAYTAWRGMVYKVENPVSKLHDIYNKLNITVCDRWRTSFHAFVEDMGPRPPKAVLCRLNPLGNYEPSNCKWGSMSENHSYIRAATGTTLINYVNYAKNDSNMTLEEYTKKDNSMALEEYKNRIPEVKALIADHIAKEKSLCDERLALENLLVHLEYLAYAPFKDEEQCKKALALLGDKNKLTD